MSFLYFDPEKIRASMCQLRESSMAQVMATAKSQRDRDILLAQDELFDSALTVDLAIVRLANEGRDSAFIAHVAGSIADSLNALSDGGDGKTTFMTEVAGTPGGRA